MTKSALVLNFNFQFLEGFLTMRVAIYARVSAADQSVERQVRELREYAQTRGWEIVREFCEVAGGAGQKRPQRDKILRMVRRRALDAILVHALDRWGRSVQDLVLTMAEIEALGVAFVVPGHIDMTTPMGRMLAHFLGAVAEFERELIRERVRSGLANARAKGKRLGRPPAVKYRVEKGLFLIEQGKTYREAALKSGVSISTLVRAKRSIPVLPGERKYA
ncbi:MAG: recombinase family protein [Desulfobacterales bacterium]|nr:MAG: recombinase family protein [Desulfobacterales bacterium]